MATFTLAAKGYPEPSGTKTLSGTTAQSVAVTNASGGQLREPEWLVEIVNTSTTTNLGFTASGTTATSSNSITVFPSSAVAIPTHRLAAVDDVISVVGNGNTFEVNLLPRT